MLVGMKLGISTMAAAALGNTISDLLGIGSAWYVESFADRLGEWNFMFVKNLYLQIHFLNRTDCFWI